MLRGIRFVFRVDAVFCGIDNIAAVFNGDCRVGRNAVTFRGVDGQFPGTAEPEGHGGIDASFSRQTVFAAVREGNDHISGGFDVNCRLAGGGDVRTVQNKGHVLISGIHDDHTAVRSGEGVRTAFRDSQIFVRCRVVGKERCGGMGLRRCRLRFRRCRTRSQQQSGQNYHMIYP